MRSLRPFSVWVKKGGGGHDEGAPHNPGLFEGPEQVARAVSTPPRQHVLLLYSRSLSFSATKSVRYQTPTAAPPSANSTAGPKRLIVGLSDKGGQPADRTLYLLSLLSLRMGLLCEQDGAAAPEVSHTTTIRSCC